MKCAICDSNDWHDTGLHSKAKMLLCKPCGYCAHLKEPEEEEKIRQYYRTSYRKDKIVGVKNIVTTNNKKTYVNLFLQDFLKDKKGLTIGDVGAATGYLLHNFKLMGHNVAGSTWETMYRRFSEHYYGVPLAEELETKHRYDLIIMYHTLEHMIEPDKKLFHYRSLLKDDGHMLVSCPPWFGIVEQWEGLPWQDFEYFFHPDHIDIFSKESMRNLFNKVGLEVVKEDHLAYGQTYLLRKCAAKPIVPESWEAKFAWLKRVKQADELFRQKKKKEALDVVYEFPDVHINLLMDDWGKDREKQEDYWSEVLSKHPKNKRLSLAYGSWLYQGARYQEALDVYMDVSSYAPGGDLCIYIAWCHSMMGDHKQAMAYLNWAANLNPTKFSECMDAIGKEACDIPAWDERAREALKEQLFNQAVAGQK